MPLTSTSVVQKRRRRRAPPLPPELDRRFEAVVFDWDGTAVPNRTADAGALRALVESLTAHGMDLAVITGTHVGNVDRQLTARPAGPGRVFFCVNRGSEVYEADADGLHLVVRRDASDDENAALDAAAAATVAELGRRGVDAAIVSQRLNRRKVDLIPLPEWDDPPKARIAALLAAVEARLRRAGLTGIQEAVEIALGAARGAGIADPRVTSDAKHVEVGLTDKADSSRWVFDRLWRSGIAPGLVLIAGDEFGPLGGMIGSDSYLLVPEAGRATVVSVGAEPTGTPAGVIALGGGPESFRRILEDQLERRVRGDVPDVDDDPQWTLDVPGVDPRLERVHESLLALADGRLGTRGTPVVGNGLTNPEIVLAGVYDGTGAATQLVRAPQWSRVSQERTLKPRRRRLDLRTGVLREDGPVTSVRFSSLARPATVALRAVGRSELLPRGRRWSRGSTIRLAARDRRRGVRLDRLGAFALDEPAARAALADGSRRLRGAAQGLTTGELVGDVHGTAREPDEVQRGERLPAGRLAGYACDEQRELDVLHGSEHGHQVVELEDEAHPPSAIVRSRAIGQL